MTQILCLGTASIGGIGESSDILSSDISSPDSGISLPAPSIPSSANTRSSGKAKKTKKDREAPYREHGVVYPPGDINGLARKLH